MGGGTEAAIALGAAKPRVAADACGDGVAPGPVAEGDGGAEGPSGIASGAPSGVRGPRRLVRWGLLFCEGSSVAEAGRTGRSCLRAVGVLRTASGPSGRLVCGRFMGFSPGVVRGRQRSCSAGAADGPALRQCSGCGRPASRRARPSQAGRRPPRPVRSRCRRAVTATGVSPEHWRKGRAKGRPPGQRWRFSRLRAGQRSGTTDRAISRSGDRPQARGRTVTRRVFRPSRRSRQGGVVEGAQAGERGGPCSLRLTTRQAQRRVAVARPSKPGRDRAFSLAVRAP